MALEAGTYISDLVAANPDGASPKSSMDDHLRLIKGALKATFPAVAGAVAASHAELGFMAGATTQPAMKDGSNVATPALGDSSTKLATTAFVAGTAFSSALPAQAGNTGKFITTNGVAASWATIPPPSVIRSARTANAILSAADNATLIDITSGTFTQTFTAAATLGSGWYCYLRNNGTGDITLDPNGAELIDALANFIMYQGETRLVQCDGVGFNSLVATPFKRAPITSGNFVEPPGYAAYDVYIQPPGGAGGSGRRDASSSNKVGGAGGGMGPSSDPRNRTRHNSRNYSGGGWRWWCFGGREHHQR